MKQNIWSCRSVVVVVVLVMGIGFPSLGCFSPSFEEGRISCGPNGECPPGLSCAADRVCRSTSMPIDAAVDAKLIDGKPPIDGDTTAPNVPTLTLVTSSPANNNTPQLTGTTEVGTTVAIYTDSGCVTPEPGFEAVSMASLGTGVLVPVAGDTTTQFRARAKDPAGNPSACTSPVTYIEDSTAPVPPMVVDSLPASPSRSLTPTVRGTAEAGATVTLFSDAGCTMISGTPMVTDVGGAFAIPVSVTVGSTSTFYATARDVALNVSGCSLSNVGYNQDSSAVAVPTFTGTNPASPSKTSTTPMILGTTEASITVKLYTDNACNGTVAASGSSDASGLFSIPVTVAANTSMTFYGQAQDPVAGTLSLCSGTGITYTHDTVAPMPPLLTGSTPTSPSNATAPSVRPSRARRRRPTTPRSSSAAPRPARPCGCIARPPAPASRPRPGSPAAARSASASR
ncbi:MAG: hypothetical protein NT062_00425 [Proteobacteria bacterium]|nr:hypothetical protein [Pseudomonadota bacterium]